MAASDSAVAVPVAQNGMAGVDDDVEYLATHTHPRAHPHEKEPEGAVLHALYALEGGDPDSEVDVVHEAPGAKSWFSFRTFLSYTGPGFLMCIAFLDPGNIQADLQVGAYTGYSLLWMLLLAHVLGLVLQCMAVRLGVVTGKNLARVCKEQYGRKTSFALWVLIELAIIGCDLQEIVGSAIAFQILFGFPLWLGCLITFVDTLTFLAIHYWGVRKLEAVFIVLVATMTVCFFITFGKEPPPASEVAAGFIPNIKPYAVLSAVGLIGAVIMPHNIYLHSALVLSRRVNRRDPQQVKEANKYFSIDSAVALAVAFVINLAVVSCFAYHFFDVACARVDNSNPLACLSRDSAGQCVCGEIGLERAHDALADVLGKSAKYIWGVGLLAAGQSSTMTGTFAGQYVMEGFLDLKIPLWMRVTFTRLVAIGPGLLVAILTENNKSLSDKFQEWINVSQSVLLSFSLLPVLHFTSSPRLMGPYKSGRITTLAIWLLACGVLAINIYLVVSSIGGGQPWWVYTIAAIAGVVYLAFCFSLVQDDVAAGYGHLLAILPASVRRYLPAPPALKEIVAGGEEDDYDGGMVSLPAVAAPVSPTKKEQLANPLLAGEVREGGGAGGVEGEGK